MTMIFKQLKLKLVGFLIIGLIFAANPSGASSISGYQIVDKTNSQANTMKQRLLKERDKEIDDRTATAQGKLQSINESAEIEIAKVPRYYYNGWGYKMPNPDYESSVSYIKIDAQKQAYRINQDLAAMIKIVNASYQEKLNAIDDSKDNFDSQIRPGTSEIQMTPVGSNMYVKNYVNYAIDPPKQSVLKQPLVITGLKAKQEALANKQTNKVSN
jgi:hypothetical protein